jgi:hypothetical protein
MKPTPKLRFVEREVHVIVEPMLNITTGKTIRILQQWWENNMTINLGWTGDMPLGKTNGEWRDVPVEVEA